MTEKKAISRAMLDVQSELENLCELSASSGPDQLTNYRLTLKSWQQVWEQLRNSGDISRSDADEAMSRIATTCNKLGIDINDL